MPEPTAPILYESHCHTPLCKHAVGDPEDYCAMALLRGLRGIIFTCHAPLPNGWSADVRMSDAEFAAHLKLLGTLGADALWSNYPAEQVAAE